MDTPKKRFQQDKKSAEKWATITKTELFQSAVDHAMMQLLESQPLQEGDAASILGRTYHMQGARKFRDILEKLGDTAPEPAKVEGKINYGA